MLSVPPGRVTLTGLAVSQFRPMPLAEPGLAWHVTVPFSVVAGACVIIVLGLWDDVFGIRLRVWERGAGLTQACGTGACATAVAAIRRKLVCSPIEVHLPGGSLTINWVPGGTIRMSGAATHVFSGEIDL